MLSRQVRRGDQTTSRRSFAASPQLRVSELRDAAEPPSIGSSPPANSPSLAATACNGVSIPDAAL